VQLAPSTGNSYRVITIKIEISLVFYMDNFIIIAHVLIVLVFILYLLVRFVISLFGLTNSEFQSILRSRFSISDWTFSLLVTITGIYPLIALGRFELYHILKLMALALILFLLRYAKKINFTLATTLSIVLIAVASVSSFKDQPTFPVEAGTFGKQYPEISSMSEIEQGQFIFTKLCVECHGHDGKKGRFQAADLTISKLSLQQKEQTVRNGSPLTVMRSFEKELSDKEIEAVVDYAHSLAD